MGFTKCPAVKTVKQCQRLMVIWGKLIHLNIQPIPNKKMPFFCILKSLLSN